MALRLIGVSKRYGDQPVLDGVSLHVRAGDCYGFLGHNGAGKTTAMRIALGLVAADAGRVVVDGFDADEHPLEARARMGALIEVPGFHPHLSGLRNLVLLARLQGLSADAAGPEARRVLEAVGLAHAADKAAGAYSQGMRQRLGIAQAILGRPRIVLLDEPTNGLDPEGIEEIRRLLRRLTAEEGVTVLLSSHQLHELSGVCNRVGILRQGRLLVEDETARLLAARGRRQVLRTSDDAAARKAIAALGITMQERASGGVEFDPGPHTPGEIARVVIASGVELQALAPREATLEEIYLDTTRHAHGAAKSAEPEPPATGPQSRIAPPGSVRRTAMYDVRRWFSTASVPASLVAPAVVAALAVLSFHAGESAASGEVEAGRLATATHHTAFTATARGLSRGLPLLALVASATAALSIAGEYGRGTLRNVVLRPVGRARLVLGKVLAASAAATMGYVLLALVAMGVAGALFDFGDLVEILPGGQRFAYEGFAAKDLWPELARSLAWQFPAVLAFAAVGALVGSWSKGGAGAVVGVFSTTLVMIGLPAFVGRGAAQWVPSAYLPWVVSDASPTRRLYDLSTGVSNAAPLDSQPLWVPALWFAAAVAAACWTMRRRPIP
jgi:ABC-2 type transport system ATP-binding protein